MTGYKQVSLTGEAHQALRQLKWALSDTLGEDVTLSQAVLIARLGYTQFINDEQAIRLGQRIGIEPSLNGTPETQHKSDYGARLVCADCGKPPDACLCADVAIDDYGATPESWCDCDWLGEGTPRHAPSALCRDMRPEGPRSE